MPTSARANRPVKISAALKRRLLRLLSPVISDTSEKSHTTVIPAFAGIQRSRNKFGMTFMHLPPLLYKILLSFVFLSGFMVVGASHAEAANLYWVGSAGAATNVASNWKTTDPSGCGSGDAGAAPGASDVAIFDADCDNNAAVTSSFSVQGVSIQSGYSGTVSQNAVAMTIGSSGWTQAGGTFTGNSDGSTANITIQSGGDFSLTGGTFTSTNDTLNAPDEWSVSGGTFTHNSGTVQIGELTDDLTMTGSVDFYDLTFSSTANTFPTVTLASGTILTVNNTLTLVGGTQGTKYLIGPGGIYAKGSITVTGYGWASDPTTALSITINGTGSQIITGENDTDTQVPAIVIDKSLGTLSFVSNISATNSWTYTQGTLSMGTSTVYFWGGSISSSPCSSGCTITGSMSFYNLAFYNSQNVFPIYTIASGTNLTATNTLSFHKQQGAFTINGPGTITAQGDITTSNNGAGGSLSITLTGGNSQTITAAGSSLPTGTLTINKSSGTVTLATNFPLSGSGQDLLISRGTLDLASYTLTVNDNITVSKNAILQTTSGGDLVIGSGGVTNSGQINVGKAETCGASDTTSITSSSSGNARTWSGNGTYSLYDITVQDQSESPYSGNIVAWSSTNNGNTNFKFPSGCPPPPAAEWKFDDGQGQTTQDATTNNNDGTFGANTSSSSDDPGWLTEDQCISGKCISLDGTADYVSIADSNSLDLRTSFTISTWVYLNSIPNNCGTDAVASIFNKGRDSTSTYAYNLDIQECGGDSGKAGIEVYNGTTVGTAMSTTVLATNRWYHIAGTYDGSNLRIYVNGKLESTTSTSVDPGNQTSAVAIGKNPNAANRYLPGKIDELKVYTYPRSAAQVKSDYNQGAAAVLAATTNQPRALSDGLVGYWKMDESSWTNNCSTDTVMDSSGNGNNGDACPNSTGPTGGASGKFGNAGSFDGSNDNIQVANSASLNSADTNWTVAGWFYDTNAHWNHSDTAIVYKQESDGSANAPYQIKVAYHNFEVSGESGYSPSGIAYNLSSGGYSTNTWIHFVATYASATREMSLYLNGTRVAGPTVVTAPGSNSERVEIGGSSAHDRDWLGKLDDIRIYNRTLSGSDISLLYNWAPGPVGYWKMDDVATTAAAATLVDASGQGNNISTDRSSGNYPVTASGKYGKAIDPSSGTADHNRWAALADASQNGVLDQTGPMTVEAWVRINSTTSCDGNAAVSKGLGSTTFSSSTQLSYRLVLDCNSGGGSVARGVKFTVSPDGTSTNEVSTTTQTSTTMSANTWYHFTGVYTGSQLIAYLNAVPYTSPVSYSSGIFNSTGNFTVGGTQYSGGGSLVHDFNGVIDDVKLYNYARTPAQIVEDMNAGHPAPGSPVGTPYGHWRFEEGTPNTCSGGVKDACNSGNGGNSLDGTFAATPTYTNEGKFGKAISFNGSTGNSDMSALESTESATQISWSMWVKPTTLSTDDCLFCKIQAPTGSVAGAIWGIITDSSDSSKVKVIIPNATNSVASYGTTPTGTLSNGTWTHLMVVYDGTQATDATKLVFYVNGKRQTLAFSGTAIPSSTTTSTTNGRLAADSQGSSNFFNGVFDEIKVYTQPLTEAQVQLDMNQGQAQVLGAAGNKSTYEKGSANQAYCVPGDTTSCAAPVGEWNLDEGSGTTARDTSGNENTGTITAGSGGYVTSKGRGKAYNFDALTTSINAGSGTSLDNLTAGAMTIEAWVYPKTCGESFGGGNRAGFILAKNVGSTQSSGWIFACVNAFGPVNALSFLVDGSTDFNLTSSNNVLTFNRWQHVAISFSGFGSASTSHIYINGVETGYQTTTNGASRTSDASSTTYLGNSSTNDRTWDGYIDQLRVFNYARTPAQIAWDYNQGAPTAHWRMDECQGTTINDSSGNSLTGTLTLGAAGITTAGTCTTSGAWFNGASGKRNYGMNFDGSDDYISIADNDLIDVSDSRNFSVSFWANLDILTTDETFIAKKNSQASTDAGYMVFFNDPTDVIDFRVADGTDQFIISSNTISTSGSWIHITAVYVDGDATNSTVYVNGLPAKASTTGNIANVDSLANALALRIGEQVNNNSPLDGKMDDVKLFNYALSPTQVKTIFNEGAAIFGQ